MTKRQQLVKRTFDVGLATVGLVAVGWLIGLAALIARWDTGKSGIFRQVRVGHNGKPFEIFKVRTMRDVPGIDTNVTTLRDPRITRLGRLFRQTKIDELPQLLNILRGEISFVGPRPTVEEDYRRMDASQRRRCDVLPGLTGLAQIRGNTSLSWPERIEHDLEYISRRSVWLDVKILVRTVALVFVGNSHTDPLGSDEWEKAA